MTRPVALVLRALGLGDFFTGLPALDLLRRALPDHRIVLALPRGLHPLANLVASIDATVNAHELEPIESPPVEPDLAVDLHGNGPASRDLLCVTSPRRVIAYADGAADWRPGEHEVRRWLRLVRDGLPTTVPARLDAAGALPVVPHADVPDGATVVFCGAKAPSRRWAPDRFARVAAALRAAGHRVVVVGGGDEVALAQRIAARAGVPSLTGLSVLELVALIARARLVVSGDTGPAHVASNYATASVVLFGPVSPAVWGPPDRPYHQVLWHGDGSGDPHADTIDPALLAITVDEVLAACTRALTAGGAGGLASSKGRSA